MNSTPDPNEGGRDLEAPPPTLSEYLDSLSPLDDETGWLIEDRSNARDSLYMAMADCRFGETREKHIGRFKFEEYESPLRFVSDSNEALRFARAGDAEAFIRVFRRFMLVPEATEHCWPTSAIEARQGGDGTAPCEAREPGGEAMRP